MISRRAFVLSSICKLMMERSKVAAPMLSAPYVTLVDEQASEELPVSALRGSETGYTSPVTTVSEQPGFVQQLPNTPSGGTRYSGCSGIA